MKLINNKYAGVIIILTLFEIHLSGCHQTEMDISELRSYIRDPQNGLTYVESTDDSVRATISLIRPELLNRKFSGLPRTIYILANLEKNGREGLPQINRPDMGAGLNGILEYGLSEYCRLIRDGKDTIKLNNQAASHTYGLAPTNTILLSFSSSFPQKGFEFQLDDFGVGLGDKRFYFTKEHINNLYQITLK